MSSAEPGPPAFPDLLEVHRDVTAGGVRLRTTEWSTAASAEEGDALVALPGAFAPRLSFRPLAALLAPRFRIFALDFPGFGDSEKPPPQRYPYGPAAFTEVLIDLFAGLGLPRAHVLGFGLGGAVALHLGARHPELVRRLALIAPQGQPASASSRLPLLVAPLLGGLLFRQIINQSLFSTFYRECINPRASQELIASHYEAIRSPASRAALLSTLRGSLDPHPVIADCRRVRAPTLLVWGRQDRLFPVERGRLLSREMPAAGLEIVETGHAPHEQAPELIAPTLLRFFSGQRAGSN